MTLDGGSCCWVPVSFVCFPAFYAHVKNRLYHVFTIEFLKIVHRSNGDELSTGESTRVNFCVARRANPRNLALIQFFRLPS